jgi:ligand-binding sensor domain-containing protein/signal transduction histidine kinase
MPYRFAPLSAWRLSLLLLAFLWASPLGGVDLPTYSIRTWRTEDGLPQNGVTVLLQSRDGYLWLGTLAGLVRFDGHQFTVFDTDKSPDLPNDRITALYEDADRGMWLGHETGHLTQLQGGRFQGVELPAAWAEDVVSAIDRDRSGDLWIQSREGRLARVRDGLVFPPEDNPISRYGQAALARDRHGDLWATRGGRLCRLADGELSVAPQPPVSRNDFIQCLGASSDGGLWAIRGGRLTKFRDGSWNEFPSGGATLANATGLLELRSGWVAVRTTDRGLWLVHPEKPARNFSRTNGLSSNWLGCLCQDQTGDLWVGSSSGGLSVLRPVTFEALNPPDQWEGMAALSVTRASDNSLWVGTEGAGLYRFQEGGWTKFGSEHGLASRFIWSVLEDRQRRVWVGTWGGGVFFKPGDRFQPAVGLTGVQVPATALMQGRAGELWIGTKAGLVRYENGQTTWLGQSAGVALADVRALAQDGEGAVWFGMMGGGLGCWKDGVVRQFRKRDGLSSDFVLCLHFDEQGSLWIGTSGGGLNRLKSQRFSKIGTREGLPNSIISTLQPDDFGYYWLGSAGGIVRVSRQELDRCADGQIDKIAGTTYGVWDGLPTSECSGGFQPSSCRTADGRLWFPTRKGLVCVDPSSIQTNTPPPPVVVEQFLADGVPYSLWGHQARALMRGQPKSLVPLSLRTDSKPLVVGPGRQRLEFHFTALSLAASERVEFRYQLAGYDDAWVPCGTRRTASYSTLPPGDYVFNVQACAPSGPWSPEPASLGVVVLPFVWQTWWFRLLSYLAGAGATVGVVSFALRRRHRRKFEKLERLQALERERARIAQDIHDDLGASLTRIGLLSQTAGATLTDPQRTAGYLEQIYTSARDLTRAMDEIVWAVNPRHDTLESLVNYLTRFAYEFLGAANIRCRIAFPVQLPEWKVRSEIRHNVFLAFKEALNNTVRHSGAQQVRVSLQLQPQGFELLLEDDGRGFNPSSFPAPAPSADRLTPGNGLANIRHRLSSIAGTALILSEPGQGARVLFTVPLQSVSGEEAHRAEGVIRK